jgi:hypothetical protein
MIELNQCKAVYAKEYLSIFDNGAIMAIFKIKKPRNKIH